MRKSLFVFLALLLVAMPVFTGCPAPTPAPPPELTSADATAKMEFYFESFFYGHTGLLVKLDLMTEKQVDDLFNQQPKEYAGDIAGLEYGYYEIGVSYADFKNACTRYLSQDYFDRYVFCCLVNLDGNLVYPAVGHGGGWIENLRNTTLANADADNHRYQYTIEVDQGEYDELFETWRYEFTFVWENDRYVIDNISSAEV